MNNVMLKPERGIDTVDAHEDILSENKDNVKTKASAATPSNASSDQTKRQEEGNDIGNETTSSPAEDATDTLLHPGPRVKDIGHEISKDCMKKTRRDIHAPVENSVRTIITSHSKTN